MVNSTTKKSKIFKKKYETRFAHRALGVKENRQFLLEHIKREWERMEEELERDSKRQKWRETLKVSGKIVGLTILTMVLVCGVLIVGAVAPNIFSAFGRLGRHRRYFDKKDLRGKIGYYRRRGYLNIKEDITGVMEIKLTKFGEAQTIRKNLANLKIAPQDKWDGIWRVLMFDIREKNRWGRDGLRQYLKSLGFYPLQKSVFVIPYPCKDVVEFLARLYDVDAQVRLIETNTISFDDDLRDVFGLR